jgi:hypothetical protein
VENLQTKAEYANQKPCAEERGNLVFGKTHSNKRPQQTLRPKGGTRKLAGTPGGLQKQSKKG